MDADPQANAWFRWAAYGVTTVILVGYGVSLWRRARAGREPGGQGARESGGQGVRESVSQ